MNEDQIKEVYSSFYADYEDISETEIEFVKHVIDKYIEHLYNSAKFGEAAMDYRGAFCLHAQDAFDRMFDVMGKCDD